ncbi:MAG: hypothetical protein WCF40_15055 [Desulfobacterales bacterium]|jgi:hypothetical protein
MEENRNRRWLIIGFFLLIGLLFVGFIYMAVVGPRSIQSQQRLERAVSSYENKMKARSDEKTVILSLGLVISVGKIKMIYRGLEGDRINVDVIIPELDPETAYHHSIHESEAKRGLKLGGQDFELISASETNLRLNRVKR